MKRVLLALAFVVLGSPCAFAGVDEWAPIKWVKNSIVYVIDQPDCAWAFVKGAVTPHNTQRGDVWDWVACHAEKANRVPTTLTPIIP